MYRHFQKNDYNGEVFVWTRNRIIPFGAIPNNTIRLQLLNFNQVIDPGVIPNSVKSINFGDVFNRIIEPGVIPNSVTKILFGDDFNQILVPGSIPLSVTHLLFGRFYNQPLIERVIPESVIHLYFVSSPNSLLVPKTIPNGVKYLHIGNGFNKKLDESILPYSLTHLTLSNDFDKEIISDSVTHLYFHTWYNHPIRNIPLSVRKVTVGEMFKNIVDIDLNIKIICCYTNYQLFVGRKFHRVQFYTLHRFNNEDTYDKFQNDTMFENSYIITTHSKSMSGPKKVMLRLIDQPVKSARKF